MTETVGWLGSWLRLLWRHWPVLLSLAFAALIIRTLLIEYALVEAARWRDGLGGWLAFGVLPIVMLVTMILMLRTVRPSLAYLGPREKPEPVLRHLASVAIPFVAFYFGAGYLLADYQYFSYSVAATSALDALDAGLGGALGDVVDQRPAPEVLGPEDLTLLVVIAVAAFVLRWILSLLGAGRRTWLALIAVYPEVLWVTTAFVVANQFAEPGRGWFERTRLHQGVSSLVEGWDLPFLTSLFPNVETAFGVLVVPITALVTGTTVLVASRRPRPQQATGLLRFLPVRSDAQVGGQFAALREALRHVFRAGVGATMVFCLAFALVRASPGYLGELERLLIGPRDPDTIWNPMWYSLILLKEGIALVLVVSLIAAFVDRSAHREARRSGEEGAPPLAFPPRAAPGSAAPAPATPAAVPPGMAPPAWAAPSAGHADLTTTQPIPAVPAGGVGPPGSGGYGQPYVPGQ